MSEAQERWLRNEESTIRVIGILVDDEWCISIDSSQIMTTTKEDLDLELKALYSYMYMTCVEVYDEEEGWLPVDRLEDVYVEESDLSPQFVALTHISLHPEIIDGQFTYSEEEVRKQVATVEDIDITGILKQCKKVHDLLGHGYTIESVRRLMNE